jgi:hypothetical protein
MSLAGHSIVDGDRSDLFPAEEKCEKILHEAVEFNQ